MNFKQRVARRWKVAIVMAIVGFFTMLALVAVLLFFTVIASVPMSDVAQRIVAAVTLFGSGIAFWCGWSFRSLFIINIDTVVRDMGPLQRKMLVAQIEEEEREP